jgi:hypothetical protein
MTEPKKRAKKKAPRGYYTAEEVRLLLGLRPSTFTDYVKKGKIPGRKILPLRERGVYEKAAIDKLIQEMEFFVHTDEMPAQVPAAIEDRVAQHEDAPGIVYVLTIRGWSAASAEQRQAWYERNPLIDYIVLWNNEVMGYAHGVPYQPDALEDMMAGRKRAWNIEPEDIQPYMPGGTYDIYTGIAIRTDVPNHTQLFGRRLLRGFMRFLEGLAEQGIIIRRLYAVSAEKDGQELSEGLGFVRQPAQPGDLFPRYMLDLETSDSRFASRYREVVGSTAGEKGHI